MPTKHQRQFEQEFRRSYNDQSALVVRGAIAAGIAIYLIFYFWDLAIDASRAHLTLRIRLAVTVILAIALILPRRFFVRHLQVLIAMCTAAAGVGISAIIALLENGLTLGLAGVVLVLMFTFGFGRLLFIPSLISGAITCLAYNCAALLGHLPLNLLVANNFFLASAFLSGASATYLLERLFRSEFAMQRDLEAQRKREQDNQSERTQWLQGLSNFLRHECRNALVGVSSSLQLLSQQEHSDESRKYLDRADRSLEYMKRLLIRTAEATTLESALHVEPYEPEDLILVSSNVIDEYQNSYPQYNFSWKAETKKKISGHGERFRQLLEKLLNNALEHSSSTHAITILVRETNESIIFSVSNRGDALPDDLESMFGLFSSSNPKSKENLGLGLFVANQIATKMGARIVANRLTNPLGANFEVTFPVSHSNQ